tara:strand:+ start:21412 stop:23151 length:1740 start_codon:yes stop_codon:yes gene_type:complete
MGLWDFITADYETRLKRSGDFNKRLDDGMDYVLGPTGIPDKLRAANQFLNPISQMGQAGADTVMAFDDNRSYDERRSHAINALVGAATSLAPAVGMKMAGRGAADAVTETFLNMSARSPAMDSIGEAAQTFARSEAGSVPLGRAPAPRGADLLDLPHGVDPRYTGAAPNRTTPFPRYAPKTTPERMQRLMGKLDDPAGPVQTRLDGYLAKGRELGGNDWYNTEEFRDAAIGELGEGAGDAFWRRYMQDVGHTSTGSAVPPNLRNASLYTVLDDADRLRVAEYVRDTPRTTPRMAVEALGIDVPNMPDKYGYGHKMQATQASNVANGEAGLWRQDAADGMTGADQTKQLQGNAKVKGFYNDLLGDDTNVAVDKHFMRVLGMSDGGADFLSGQAELSAANRNLLKQTYGDALDPYTRVRMVEGKPSTSVNLAAAAKDGVIKDTTAFSEMPTAWADMPRPTEYGAIEDVANRLASERQMTPAQYQANLWMGAGDVTGLADESQGTFMDLFRKTLDKRATERGISRGDMFRDFVNRRSPLAVPLAAGGSLGLQDREPQSRRTIFDTLDQAATMPAYQKKGLKI